MKNNYEVRAMKFITLIAPYIAGCVDKWDYFYAVARFNHDYKRNVKVCNGATRIALITSDYVIKFNYGKRVRDYGGCRDEMRMYKRAEKDGYAYLFAKITAKIYNHKTYYIMPKISYIGRGGMWKHLSCDEYDYICDNLYDMHEYNYGYKNGKPVIIDYACCN